ncbi:MAG: amidohydrolase family protein [Bacteroidetes bacterium]|nr:amidohydrolase family protein [Bacteroidota bacterium]
MRFVFSFLFLLTVIVGRAQITPAPEVKEGEGPWDQLIIRGVTLINSTGAPPVGPVDIVVEKNRIVDIVSVGAPGVPIEAKGRPALKPGGHEIQAEGKFLLPGFVDMHGHIGGTEQGTPAEYVFKLWMAHGVTTIREPGSGNGLDWTLDQKRKSATNSITAPRIKAYTFFGMGSKTPISTAAQARAWVRENAKKGADGIKFFGASPEVMFAALDENRKLGLRSACHHAQLNVGRWNVMNSAYAGLTTMEHWYGLPEAIFTDKRIQEYPSDYNYNNEQDRFGEAGKLWAQTAPKGSARWNEVMDTLLKLNFTIDPTFIAYDATRDLNRMIRHEWHQTYTLPSLWRFYYPNRLSHGSFWQSWGTEQEIAWKKNFRLWMDFINEYKNRGGRVTIGTDCGFLYNTYGFAYPREMEILQEAGFHPLEVIRAATLNGAEALGMDSLIGSVEVGKLADFVLMDQNPLTDFKLLYATGTIRLTADNIVVREGGVRYTIKDGIVYDAKKLLQDVKRIVEEAKKKEGITELKTPGS